MHRRSFLASLLAAGALQARAAAPLDPVVPGRPIRFPQDEGNHPGFRTEWWYVTGWLRGEDQDIGFQVTFFRTRAIDPGANPSRFAPRHLLIAHAAISWPPSGRLLSAQRIARAGFGLAEAQVGRTDVRIDDWSLRQAGDVYRCTVPDAALGFDLRLTRTQPPLLHGDGGYSRKGPSPGSASYYYSLPHLAVRGTLGLAERSLEVAGSAWLDHEWSTALMEEAAAGWDWIGINLDDGGALMAFRMRGRDGARRWAAATYRSPAGERRVYPPEQVAWHRLSEWRSPRTGIVWPVAFDVRVGELVLRIEPLMPDQEHDARATARTVYWEGAVHAHAGTRRVGRGYLELTGYDGTAPRV